MSGEELYLKLLAVFNDADIYPLDKLSVAEYFFATVVGGYRDGLGLDMIEQAFRNVRKIVAESEEEIPVPQ